MSGDEQTLVEALEAWRDQWLVPVVDDADTISGADQDLAGAIDRWRAAARPTSLPEAPEPEVRRAWRCNALGVMPCSPFMAAPHRGPGHEGCGYGPATPSAPPVAVDPEAGVGERVWVPKPEFDALDEVLTGPASPDTCADDAAVVYFAAQLVAAHRLANRPAAAASGGDGEGTGNDG